MNMVGFSVYLFEGVGIGMISKLVLPIYSLTEKKHDFMKILSKMMIFLIILYAGFGWITLFAYGSNQITPLIMDCLPKNYFVYSLKLLYIINLIITYPL